MKAKDLIKELREYPDADVEISVDMGGEDETRVFAIPRGEVMRRSTGGHNGEVYALVILCDDEEYLASLKQKKRKRKS